MSPLVLRDDANGIATLTLNRPDKRNALNLALWGELDAHADAIADAGERIGAVILRAAGPVFCAGNDLKERGLEAPRPHYQASIVTRLAELREKLQTAYAATAAFAAEHGCTLRQAAFAIGIRRVAQASRARGYI